MEGEGNSGGLYSSFWMDGWTETSGQLFSGRDFNQLVHEYNCLVW